MSQQSRRNILEQGRAEFAYQCAEKASKENYKEDYKPYVKKIPMLIKTNGLGATIAYIKSKSKEGDAYSAIYKNISEWLVKKGIISEKDELIEVIIQINSSEYRQITIEVLAFLNWLKRFADGLIQKSEENESDGER
ncbi:MAG: type III-B CRISPR module-associated protein Cmr5 [Pseudomonadota bacterium]|nr:type III-B CRISPR module-associated protein Cmr5 [Pseudomonadota bacterium]